ncbi:TPA: HAMP domain-containing histidine kinase [Streptococcus suis]|uniref:sensor histidine kinase n=1 Tax=Streptococcus pluranimalium TaxID=82348 RepID=UPI002414E194|nr:HAMP domain-containing sensor histidine kinase [Streptococcus pluranimalium]WFM79215.1 HAMP domain-containing sensor histidine kinase [Streptococcus pluranimalium]HEM6116295.1 HAMP domain-containing histidine kinase [Streptococcus suis]
MALNKKGQTLKVIFLKYLGSVGIGLVIAIGVSLLSFITFYQTGLIIPANETENQIIDNKTAILHQKKFDDSLIPDKASYIYLNLDGEILQSNMTKENEIKAIHFHNREEISTPRSSFIEYKRPDGYIIINYQLEPHYSINWMNDYFPKINFLFASLLIVFCFISTFLVTLFWAKYMTKQLIPMMEASQKIAQQNLDIEISFSKIREFNDVLNSIDNMKRALSLSLKENWLQEEEKRNQISALTHDLKTPTAIVKGNAELLSETDLTEEQSEYVSFIIKNMNRISEYTKTLMTVNQSIKELDFSLEKVSMTDFIERVRLIASEIVEINGRLLKEDIDVDNNILLIDLVLFERAFQNLLNNAIQYSPDNAPIEIMIETATNKLYLSVIDQGSGFSLEDLAHGVQQFYRGDKSRHSSDNYGLGLYIASQIMTFHSGELILENTLAKDGAKVTLVFPLL